jgi:hypothetical protein
MGCSILYRMVAEQIRLHATLATCRTGLYGSSTQERGVDRGDGNSDTSALNERLGIFGERKIFAGLLRPAALWEILQSDLPQTHKTQETEFHLRHTPPQKRIWILPAHKLLLQIRKKLFD